MSDLPEDLNLWPSDPFELLNVKRTDDARTAKRAYFKLARKYKPDRFPAEFQKVRQAYESVENWLSWQHQYTDPDPVSDDANESVTPVAPSTVDDTQVDRADDHSDQQVDSSNRIDRIRVDRVERVDQSEPVEDVPVATLVPNAPMDRFVETLSGQGISAAFVHLNNLDPSSHGSDQVASANLAKYFVGRFLPKSLGNPDASDAKENVLRADQMRISFLLKSLENPSASFTALSQLKTEFDRNNQLANCEAFKRYLAKSDDFKTLGSLYELRWEAIGHYQPAIVVEDLNRLRPMSLESASSQEQWTNLLVASMNYTVWYQDPKIAAHTEQVWSELCADNQSWAADSVELLMVGAEQWKTMPRDTWSAAIPWTRGTLPETFRKIWLPVAQQISANPIGSLELMEPRFNDSSLAMSLFSDGLHVLMQATEKEFAEPDWDEARKLVACFFEETGATGYYTNRRRLLEFCIFNQLSPYTFASAADSFIDHSRHETASWSDLIEADQPLKCVLLACLATNW